MATNKTKSKSTQPVSLFYYMNTQIDQKRLVGKDATADLYRASCNWLKKFMHERPLYIHNVTPGTVDQFKQFLLLQGHLKTNSINSYMSCFRAIYNSAIHKGIVHPHIHPFTHLSIHTEQTTKRAARKEMMEEIAGMDLKKEPELARTADLCTFSYLACGIPFIDLVHLTKENIQGSEIVYQRTKTGIPIRIGITAGMQMILNKYATPDSIYLFPILPDGCNTKYETYKTLLRNYNKELKEIGNKLSIPIRLTSYVIRHTWATEALRQHIPVAIISQALGHTSEKTTRCYLAQLDQSELNQANAIITGSVDHIIAGKGRMAG